MNTTITLFPVVRIGWHSLPSGDTRNQYETVQERLQCEHRMEPQGPLTF